MDPPNFALFGSYAKRLRESRGWSLEDLARRFDSDRANIHRVEKGSARPRYDTVGRLAKALDATPDEAAELYARAGYQPPVSPTSAADFEAVLDQLKHEWLTDSPPAILIVDVFWTIWYANAAFATFFAGGDASRILGKHYLALCFDRSYGFVDVLSRLADERAVDEFLSVMLARVRRRVDAGDAGLGGAESQAEVSRLKQLPGFAKLWERAAPDQTVPGDALASLNRLRLRGDGYLVVVSAPILRDRRFYLVYFLPADEQSARLLAGGEAE